MSEAAAIARPRRRRRRSGEAARPSAWQLLMNNRLAAVGFCILRR